MSRPPSGSSPRTPTRTKLLFGAKVVVAAALIGWLIRSGALDMRALGIFFRKPELLAMDLLVFAAASVIGTLRWRALLGIADVRPPFARLLQLQLVALFFNVVIPGSVGGDVVKALYVLRDEKTGKHTTILLIVFIERLLGLAGLVTMATIVSVVRGPILWGDPLLRPMASTVALLGLGVVVGPALFFLLMRRAGERIESWTTGTTALAKLMARLVAATRLLSTRPRGLATAFAFSMALHALAMGFFTVLARAITAQDVGYAQVATVFPLGILTMVVPISPSGLGVGHMAFDKLFSAIGLTGGATIFNVYLLGQIAPCLFGVFPYLALKRRAGAVPDAPKA